MIRWIGTLALAATSLYALLMCPHSKVEESFNIQATHDLFYHGVWPAMRSALHSDEPNEAVSPIYDHLYYPGVVPRTFFGPLILSIFLKIVAFILRPFIVLQQHPLVVQTLGRAILLVFNVHAHHRLAKASNAILNSSSDFLVGFYFLLITACQFHIPFYGSRMLPNSFALGLVVNAYAEWFRSKPRNAIILMVFCTAIIRCDVLILLLTFGLTLIARKEVKLCQAIRIGLVTVAVSVILTVPFDSLMWQRPLWPEAVVLFFNTVENKSSDYGVSPWHWYALKALPKGLLLTLPLVPLGFFRLPQYIANSKTHVWDLKGLPYFIPVLGFIGLYSILPHKEMRFIFVAFPMFNLISAKGLSDIHQVRKIILSQPGRSSQLSRNALTLLHIGGILSIVLSLLCSFTFIQVSRANYPGGDALRMLSNYLNSSSVSLGNEPIKIFIDVASAMTGVSLFGQRHLMQTCTTCIIIKDGYEHEHYDSNQFHFILSEKNDISGFKGIDVALGNPQFDIRHLSILKDDTIFVLKSERL